MLKHLLLALVVPPLSFVPLLILGLLVKRRFDRIGRGLTVFALLGLLLLAVPVVSENLLVALERDLPLSPDPHDPPTAIVVLGAEIVRAAGVPGGTVPSGGAQVGRFTLDRLRGAATLARKTGLPVLVSGGLVRPDLPSIGLLMAESMARDFQLPVRWTEARSLDTWENAAFSAEILRARGIHSVYVVTHAWHMRRAIIAFKAAGLHVTAAPIRLDPTAGTTAMDYIPRTAAWETAYLAMHEWIGLAWYAIR